MWRFIAKPLDRAAIRSACGSVRPSPDGNPRIAEAAALLNTPSFFCPEVPVPDVAIQKNRFRFNSPVTTSVARNNVVSGRFEPTGHDWRQKPAVIFLHGWNAELQDRWMSPFWAQLLARRGINGFMFELPFHGSRRPGSESPIRNFLSGDVLHVMQMTQQALADARALTLWLKSQGAPAVGLWGVSLGAWLAGLAAAHHPETDAAALITPVVRMDRALQELPFCAEIRDELSHITDQFHRLNLVEHTPRIAGERVLSVAAELDLFAPLETVEAWSDRWNAELWRVRHGHISVLMDGKLMRRVADWFAKKIHAGQSPVLRES